MRLPLLCVALISVLTGCNGTCTSDRCTISSMMSDSRITSSSPYSSTPSTRYQAYAAQPSSSGGFNTPEHAKYRGIRWGGASTGSYGQSTETQFVTRSQRESQPTSRQNPADLQVQLEDELAALPRALRDATRSIKIHQHCAPEFGCKAAAATADAHTGTIDVWNGGKHLPDNSMAHEAGHLLAYKKYGSYVPPGYEELWSAEGGVSEYGSTSPTEDFAEAVEQYTRGVLQSERKREFVQKALNE